MFKCQKVQITADAESALRPSSVRAVTRKRKDRKKKKRGKEEEVRWEAGKRVDGVETERYEPMRNQKKKKSASLLDVLFFPWWSSFSGSEVKWGRGRRVMVGLGCWGWRVIVVVCARFFVLFCAYRASYQLLSGDGSLSRCMAALWCLILSRYSCWDTASTDARISSSSQSVRPETQTHKTYENF